MTRNSFFLTPGLIFLLLGLLSCQSSPLAHREPAVAQTARADSVTVYLEGQQVKYLQAPSRRFSFAAPDSPAGLEQLKGYIEAHKLLLDVNETTPLQLRTRSISKRGSKTYVRFQQIFERQVDGKKYTLPIESSSLVAVVDGSRLQSLGSHLKNPVSFSLFLQHPGFDMKGFSQKQMETFLRYMLSSPDLQKMKDYFALIAKNSNLTFDFDKFLTLSPEKQHQSMRVFFGRIKRTSTAKILIGLMQKNNLALVQHGSQWMFQVSQFFDLPLQFDILIPAPGDENKQLQVRNLRELQRHVEVDIFSQHDFPGGERELRATFDDKSPTPVTNSHTLAEDQETGRLFQNVSRYYKENFKWSGYNGTNDNTVVTVLKDISTPPWSENAFWSKEQNLFGIGSGGDSLSNIQRSVSTLGHEYTHAIVDNSSGLVYVGQTGAINEHFADLQGVGAEAYISGQPYDYTIGEDILSPDIIATQKATNEALFKTLQLSEEEIVLHSLRKVALRNLYLPELSVFPQQSTMAQVESTYGTDCQPSVDNDSCGVHSIAGVPSRAASLIISTLGWGKTRALFFNTVVFRLGANATFQEYLRQLYEECVATLNKDRDCPVILSSFEKVGVPYPAVTIPAPSPSAPAIGYCGWVTKTTPLTVIDNKADGAVLPQLTHIAAADLLTLQKANCVCLIGSLAQTQNAQGTWLNYFSEIVSGSVAFKGPEACP